MIVIAVIVMVVIVMVVIAVIAVIMRAMVVSVLFGAHESRQEKEREHETERAHGERFWSGVPKYKLLR